MDPPAGVATNSGATGLDGPAAGNSAHDDDDSIPGEGPPGGGGSVGLAPVDSFGDCAFHDQLWCKAAVQLFRKLCLDHEGGWGELVLSIRTELPTDMSRLRMQSLIGAVRPHEYLEVEFEFAAEGVKGDDPSMKDATCSQYFFHGP